MNHEIRDTAGTSDRSKTRGPAAEMMETPTRVGNDPDSRADEDLDDIDGGIPDMHHRTRSQRSS